jgi:hypothetical protein
MVGNYTSTYGFVGHLKLEEVADKVLGKGWEAEDDVSQIQSICDEISPDKYSVCSIEGLRRDDDIEVRYRDNYDEVEKLKSRLEWYNNFVDFVQDYDDSVWSNACQYADSMECEQLTNNGLTAEEVKEYYLNTGNPDYEEEPFASYHDGDWIEYANEYNLER